MPANLDALIRYHTIDKCLQNHFRSWTWENLAKACFEALNEVRYRSEKNIISKRTIENDVRIMRSSILGYNAPIICKKGLYSYNDKKYSIRNATLATKDIENIALAAKILGQYKGFSFFEDLTGILEKIETKLRVYSRYPAKMVQFEHIPASRGQEYIRLIMDVIITGQVIELNYERFNTGEIKAHIIHPYLLKEYHNRWYVLGLNDKHRKITTYALDRIKNIEIKSDSKYIMNDSFDPDTYFKNTIGITCSGETVSEVLLEVKNDFVPYLLTQPLHESQEVVAKNADSTRIRIMVIDNEELQTILMGYSDLMEVVSPERLRETIRQKLFEAGKKYS